MEISSAEKYKVIIVIDDQIPLRRSQWKKLENALIFIQKTKACTKLSKSTQTPFKRSKWILLKNVLWVVNYFVRVNLKNLQLRKSLVILTEKIEAQNKSESVSVHSEPKKMDKREKNISWSKIRNALHCIR